MHILVLLQLQVYGINSCGNGITSNSLTVNIYAYPTVPTTPTGSNSLCQNSPNTNYTTTVSTNATNYIWNIYPANAGTIF